MAARETPFRAYFRSQPLRARPSKSPQPKAAGERCPGAAAQLAAVHRTIRHGPALQLRAGDTAAAAVQRKLGFEFEQKKKPPVEDQARNRNQGFDLDADAQQGNEIEFVTGPLPNPVEAMEAEPDEEKVSPAPVKPQGKPDGKP
jgi:hypothetical protein